MGARLPHPDLAFSALPSTSGASLRALITARLDPTEGEFVPGDISADHELNPHLDMAPLDGGYYPAAVLIGLIERPDGLNVLLTRRADTLRNHAGQIAFPGGRSDPGESPAQTALREAHEEIGLAPTQVEVLGQSTTFRLQTGFDVTPVVGFVAPGFEPVSYPAEVAEVFEAPFAFLMDPANRERRLREAPGPPRWHYAITWGDRVIWGATAAMLKGLYDRLWVTADG